MTTLFKCPWCYHKSPTRTSIQIHMHNCSAKPNRYRERVRPVPESTAVSDSVSSTPDYSGGGGGSTADF